MQLLPAVFELRRESLLSYKMRSRSRNFLAILSIDLVYNFIPLNIQKVSFLTIT
jgi:hypothetical protein